MAVASAMATTIGWAQARRDGEVMKAALAAPGFFVLAVGLVLFKGYRQERLERGEDVSKLAGFALLTPRWKAVLAAALVAVAVNYVFLQGWL
jgi:hypothetical protein